MYIGTRICRNDWSGLKVGDVVAFATDEQIAQQALTEYHIGVVEEINRYRHFFIRTETGLTCFNKYGRARFVYYTTMMTIDQMRELFDIEDAKHRNIVAYLKFRDAVNKVCNDGFGVTHYNFQESALKELATLLSDIVPMGYVSPANPDYKG